MTKRDFHDFRPLARAAGNHLKKLKPYLRAEFRTRLKAESLEAQIRAEYQALKPRVRAPLVQFSQRVSQIVRKVLPSRHSGKTADCLGRGVRVVWHSSFSAALRFFFRGFSLRSVAAVRVSPERRTRSTLKRYLKYSLRIAEFALWILAASTLGYCGYAYASAAVYQT